MNGSTAHHFIKINGLSQIQRPDDGNFDEVVSDSSW